MIINGHEYSKEEVFEALRKKGYLLLPFTHQAEEDAFMGGIESFEVTTKCALKGDDMPDIKNTWENVAIREFQKEFVKPPLI